MNSKYLITFSVLLCGLLFIFPDSALAQSASSFEGTLVNIKSKFLAVILPFAAVIGLAFAAFSFFMGHEKARMHVFYAIIGTFVGFGAGPIIDFVRSLIQ